MTKLRALVEEVDAALEIHIAGRSESRFNRTTFILVDDCVELASKLFLLTNGGVAQHGNKEKRLGFHDAIKDAAKARPETGTLVDRFTERHERRNGFFHSTGLLDLTLKKHSVDEALVDLCDYCGLLFGDLWRAEVRAMASMETAEALVRLDWAARGDAHLRERIIEVLAAAPRRTKPSQKKKGCETVSHPSDQHLIMAVRLGGADLRGKLLALTGGVRP